MKRIRMLALTMLVGIAAVTAVSGNLAAAGGTKGSDPFARLPNPGALQNPTFVGHDDTGASVALVLTGLDTAVAYVCDGTGKVGEWFSGPIDLESGQISLTSKSGASFTYDIADKTGSLEIEGTTSSFTLEPATGAAGLFRQEAKNDVFGWIVDNDGLLVGEATSSGKTVAATSENLNTPVSQSTTVSTSAPVATGFFKNVQCGVLGARFFVNTTQGANAAAAGDTAGLADAAADNKVIGAKADRAGCAGNIGFTS